MSTMPEAHRRCKISAKILSTVLVVFVGSIWCCSCGRSTFLVHEVSPISQVRVLVTALISYESSYGAFPASLSELGGAETGKESSSSAAGLIDLPLASGHTTGYIFLYKPTASKRNGRNDLFMITADPDDKKNPSLPHYFVDQTGVIRVEMSSQASANSAPVKY
jgi:hypothetical protein